MMVCCKFWFADLMVCNFYFVDLWSAQSEATRNPAAPHVASSSSRGPSMLMLDILKPDVTAPRMEILAAFSPLASPSGRFYDKRSVKYNILSGTSVSCPHVTAAAAYVKSFHPEWSPSAIKSALMTTDLVKAIDAGLMYDTSMDDYHKIWCHVSNSVANFTLLNGTYTPMKLKVTNINYPSMAVHVKLQLTFAVSFLRTVTNVGRANATYVASVTKGSSKLQYSVKPKRLHFTSHNQKMSFVVTVKGESQLTIKSASLFWRDESHNVRSPVFVYTGTSTSRGE
ncbi:subtilisin-like protease SBT4.3 [Tanacetum coccineum]